MLRRGIPALILSCVAAVSAFAETAEEPRRPRTRSHRTRPRPEIPKPLLPAKPRPPAEPPAEVQARPEILSRPLPRTRRLSKGRWRPVIADALERILEHAGEGNPGYSSSDAPVIVFDLEDVAANGDIGIAVFQRMVRRADFRFNEKFWENVPQQYGRARIRAGYRGFKDSPRESWPLNPYFRMYRKGMLRAYRSICEEAGVPACRRWITSLLMNYGELDLRQYSRETLIEELNRPVGREAVGDTPEDPRPEQERAGIRLIPEMLELITQLRLNGFDAWMISTSNSWSATVFATAIGIAPSRVIGVRVKVEDGFLADEALIPTPIGVGAAEALTLFVGRTPIAVLASPHNEPVLGYGHGTRIVVHGAPLAERKSRDWRPRGWLFQPMFSAIRAPQVLPGTAPVDTAAPGDEGAPTP